MRYDSTEKPPHWLSSSDQTSAGDIIKFAKFDLCEVFLHMGQHEV